MQDGLKTKQAETKKKLFTQEEVNEIIRKRLIRERQTFNQKTKAYDLHIEVISKLSDMQIPVAFSKFIITKCCKQSSINLENFISIWRSSDRKK